MSKNIFPMLALQIDTIGGALDGGGGPQCHLSILRRPGPGGPGRRLLVTANINIGGSCQTSEGTGRFPLFQPWLLDRASPGAALHIGASI